MTAMSIEPKTHELDASGLSCPLPILKTRKVMGELKAGETLRIVASDPGSLKDMESFCNQTGNDLLSVKELEGAYEFVIRKC